MSVEQVDGANVPQNPPTLAQKAFYRDFQLLTPKETVVLVLVARGLSNLEIAGELHLSPFTVRNRVQLILEKLNAKNRANAVARAMMVGALFSDLLQE